MANAIICSVCDKQNNPSFTRCYHCKTSFIPEVEAKFNAIIATTTPNIDGRTIKKYLGVVCAQHVSGTGPVKEFLGGASDFFGGRSNTFEKELAMMQTDCLNQLKEKCYAMQGHAVIGIQFEISNMGVANSMLLMLARGTAVELESLG